MRHLGWTTRGYLPHFDRPLEIQHIVFRLEDSLPAGVLARLEQAEPAVRLEGAERFLDGGHGSCALRDLRCAGVVIDALRHFDGLRYELMSWCVMPNHVHVLARQFEGWPLAMVVHSWKSWSALQINRATGRTGAFWAREYFDRAMRSDDQAEATYQYVLGNPVAAGLCASPEDWPYSSAWCG